MLPATAERSGPPETRTSHYTFRPNLGRGLICSAVFLLPLARWAGLASAFSTPKTLLLACLDLMLAAAWLSHGAKRRDPLAGEWFVLAWVSAVSVAALAGTAVTVEALLLALLPVPMFLGLGRDLVPEEWLARAIWLGATCEAAIVVLQYCGFDPMRWLGWQPEVFASPRMRAYGTMGNPDFVAAWCCATLPFCWREVARKGRSKRSQALRWSAAVLQVAAIVATGSRVFALVLPLQAAMLAFHWKPMKRAWVLALPAAAVLLYLAPTRPLAATVQGRLYLARVAVSNLQTPLTGHGPGSFEERFALARAVWLQTHRQNPDAARFAGPVDHAHNEYLEFLVEYGPIGLAVFLGLAGWVAAQAWRSRAQPAWTVQTAAAIGALSLLVIAAVDFPFHRPAEWSLLWLLSGILAVRRNAQT